MVKGVQALLVSVSQHFLLSFLFFNISSMPPPLCHNFG